MIKLYMISGLYGNARLTVNWITWIFTKLVEIVQISWFPFVLKTRFYSFLFPKSLAEDSRVIIVLPILIEIFSMVLWLRIRNVVLVALATRPFDAIYLRTADESSSNLAMTSARFLPDTLVLVSSAVINNLWHLVQ